MIAKPLPLPRKPSPPLLELDAATSHHDRARTTAESRLRALQRRGDPRSPRPERWFHQPLGDLEGAHLCLRVAATDCMLADLASKVLIAMQSPVDGTHLCVLPEVVGTHIAALEALHWSHAELLGPSSRFVLP